MAIRLSGIISGLDTDTMVDELVSAYSTKKDNIYKEQKTLEYLQDAWKDLNTKAYSFYSGSLSPMRLSSSYSKKATTVSDATKATVSASSTAVNGTQTLKVTALAKSGYLTGAKLNGTVKGDTKLSDLGIDASAGFSITVDGKLKDISIDANTTIDQFTAKLKDAGVTASFDANNQRFYVSSKTSGTAGDFSISATNETGTAALKTLGLYSITANEISSYQNYVDSAAKDGNYLTNLAKTEYLNGLLNEQKASYADANTELNTKISDEKRNIAFAKLSDEKKTSNIEDLQKKIDETQKKYDDAKDGSTTKTNLEKTLTEYKDIMNQYTAIKSELGSSEDEGYAEKLKTYTDAHQATIDGYNKDITANKDKLTAINKAISGNISAKETYLGDAVDYGSDTYSGILIKYQDRLTYSQQMVDDYAAYTAAVESGDTETINKYKDMFDTSDGGDGAVRVKGEDSEIYLNGARYTSNTNAYSINGLTITATGITEDGKDISITTSTDVDGIYNMVKDFFTSYNTLIKEMDSKYNAASAGDYKPLTEEEEEEMSDTQVEKWETKLKDAALRGDQTLNGVISALKTTMQSSFTINGKDYNLASFGIKTLGYFSAGENEKGMYHIDGDKDDTSTSGNADKLKEAIASDPDTVVSFLSQLSTAVYKKLSDKMASSTVSSAYTLYNDKSMTKQYTNYKEKLDDWEEKIEDMREKYEKQFSSMESALSTLNSQQSSLSSMLGQS